MYPPSAESLPVPKLMRARMRGLLQAAWTTQARPIAIACEDMCHPSATRAIDWLQYPAMSSATIVKTVRSSTWRVAAWRSGASGEAGIVDLFPPLDLGRVHGRLYRRRATGIAGFQAGIPPRKTEGSLSPGKPFEAASRCRACLGHLQARREGFRAPGPRIFRWRAESWKVSRSDFEPTERTRRPWGY